MLKASRENKRERRKQESGGARQSAGRLQASPDMLLPTGVLICAALGNVFDRKVRHYPREYFSPTPKYSSLCIFSLASFFSLPPYTILGFFPLLLHLPCTLEMLWSLLSKCRLFPIFREIWYSESLWFIAANSLTQAHCPREMAHSAASEFTSAPLLWSWQLPRFWSWQLPHQKVVCVCGGGMGQACSSFLCYSM